MFCKIVERMIDSNFAEHRKIQFCHFHPEKVDYTAHIVLNFQQRNTVNGLIYHYSNMIGPAAGKVSLVYFSAPDNLTTAEYNRSGILYTWVNDATLAINYLANKNFHPLGGASDINL